MVDLVIVIVVELNGVGMDGLLVMRDGYILVIEVSLQIVVEESQKVRDTFI